MKRVVMKKFVFDQIKNQAFVDEISKIAGETSELASTVLGFPISAIPALIGYKKGPKSDVEMDKQEKHGISNILIPFVGPYRYGRRIATEKALENK